MKHTTLTLAFLVLCVLTGIAQKRTIVNPAYEVKNTGIYNVTKIELTDTATLLSMHITFVPHWWVTYDSVDVIRDCASGSEYKLKALKGGTLNKYIWMPDSGDSTVVLVYPPLPASVKKLTLTNTFSASRSTELQPGLENPPWCRQPSKNG